MAPVEQESGPGGAERSQEQAALALGLLRQLSASGVDHYVASPGSRSTPLLLAAVRTQCELRTLVDERSAAFFALGLARAGGLPALFCTSGTAPAHYLPALIEARQERLPIVVLTADRPLDRLYTGAPQTIDQARLFEAAVIDAVEIGEPDPEASDGRSIRWMLRRAAAAVALARSRGGPVHLNLRFRKPLEPSTLEELGGSSEAAAVNIYSPPRTTDRRAVERCCDLLVSARRPLVVAGPASPLGAAQWRRAVTRVMKALGGGLPVLADCASQLRCGVERAASPWLHGLGEGLALAQVREQLRPDVVLQLGRPPISTAWERAIVEWTSGAHPARHVVVSRVEADPVSTASDLVDAEPGDFTERLAEALEARSNGLAAESGWVEAVLRLEKAVVERLRRDQEEWHDGAALAIAVDSLPQESLVWLGNSLPIRLASRYVAHSPREVTFVSQRGVNGIDGNLACFAGVLSRFEPQPNTALMLIGDVALSHDLTSLEILASVAAERELCVQLVVLHNGGGRIFEQLPLADLAHRELTPASWQHWVTPSRPSFAAAAQHFGVSFRRCHDAGQLRDALDDTAAVTGLVLLEVVLPVDAAKTAARTLLEDLRGIAEVTVEGDGR